MENATRNIIEDYNIELAQMFTNRIEKLRLGMIDQDCTIDIFPILIHCVENINIFNNEQLANIRQFINKISYGG